MADANASAARNGSAAFETEDPTSKIIFSFQVNLVMGLLLFLFFCLVRGSKVAIYAPKAISAQTGKCTVGLWSALATAMWATDAALLASTHSLDVIAHIKLLDGCMQLFAVLSLVVLPFLIPVYFTGENGYSSLHGLSVGNMSDSSGRIWATVTVGWLVSVLVLYFLRQFYVRFIKIRNEVIKSEPLLQNYTILVQNIPPHLRNDIALKSFFQSFFSDVHSVHVARDLKEANRMIKELHSLQAANGTLATPWERTAASTSTASLPAYDMESARRASTTSMASQSPAEQTLRQRIKDELGIQIVQAPVATKEMEAMSEKAGAQPVLPLQQAVVTRNGLPLGFVTFQSVSSASLPAQCVAFFGDPSVFTVEPAPEPRDIIWDSPAFKARRDSSTCSGFTAAYFSKGLSIAGTVALVVLTSAAVTGVASLANLDTLSKVTNSLLDGWMDAIARDHLDQLIMGYLPTVLMALAMVAIPYLLQFLVYVSGETLSFSRIQSDVLGRHYAFLLFNFFFVFTIAGTLMDTLSGLVQHPTGLIKLLGQSLPNMSGFFVSYMILHAFTMPFVELFQPWNLFVSIARRIFCLPQVKKQISYKLGFVVPNALLSFSIGVTYGVIAPVILPLVVFNYAIMAAVWRHQLLYVYDTRRDGSGRAMVVIVRSMISGLVIAQLTLIGWISLKGGFAPAVVLAPLPIATILFAMHASRRYEPRVYVPPLEVATLADKQQGDRSIASFSSDAYIQPLVREYGGIATNERRRLEVEHYGF